MIISDEIQERINTVCKIHFVETMYLFGSAASGSMNKNSDLDILVKFSEMNLYHYFDNLLSLKDSLESIFNKPVDLLEEQAVKNPYLKNSIDNNKKLLYGRKNSQMAS
jgi:predicted nucleotidyltransferase